MNGDYILSLGTSRGEAIAGAEVAVTSGPHYLRGPKDLSKRRPQSYKWHIGATDFAIGPSGLK